MAVTSENMEKEMAPHSWIPWTEEPGRLQSMGSQRVGHNWATSLHFREYDDELFFKYLFIYLAAPGLSCDMQILSWGMCAQVLWPQTSLAPLHWEYGVLAPGPPEVLTVSF